MTSWIEKQLADQIWKFKKILLVELFSQTVLIKFILVNLDFTTIFIAKFQTKIGCRKQHGTYDRMVQLNRTMATGLLFPSLDFFIISAEHDLIGHHFIAG